MLSPPPPMQVLAQTGIAVPNYYNPMAVNPVHFAEQEMKRKQLWSKKPDVVSCSGRELSGHCTLYDFISLMV